MVRQFEMNSSEFDKPFMGEMKKCGNVGLSNKMKGKGLNMLGFVSKPVVRFSNSQLLPRHPNSLSLCFEICGAVQFMSKRLPI